MFSVKNLVISNWVPACHFRMTGGWLCGVSLLFWLTYFGCYILLCGKMRHAIPCLGIHHLAFDPLIKRNTVLNHDKELLDD